jgi:hypothetical protein
VDGKSYWEAMILGITRDRKKLNSGVRVRGVIKFKELRKFKLAIFQKTKS